MLTAMLAAAAFTGAASEPPPLTWTPCGPTPRVECATLRAPLDYDRPDAGTVSLALARLPASERRTGTMVMNFGGPGFEMVRAVREFGGQLFTSPDVAAHFDLIGLDPRGVGESRPAIDCAVDPQVLGVASQPFTTPLTLSLPALVRRGGDYVRRCLERNGPILAHASTANLARDIDLLRRTLRAPTIDFFGFSYGTVVGATYAGMFPGRTRSMVLDAPANAEDLLLRPLQFTHAQASASERALGRLLGGPDASDAFDRLVERLDRAPLPASPRPGDGDDVRAAASATLFCWQCWGDLRDALALAQTGDGSAIRRIADEFAYGDARGIDVGFAVPASELRYPRDLRAYLDGGENAWDAFDHFWWQTGYARIPYALWPIRDEDAYYGPFGVSRSSPPALVVATTYDPGTFYRSGVRLARALGNARLLTLRGDGHGAYQLGGSPDCVDALVDAYVLTLALPPAGTECAQHRGVQTARGAALR
jgi:pimeloyl-ACP methyl ester carboxylesterase